MTIRMQGNHATYYNTYYNMAVCLIDSAVNSVTDA